MSEFMNIAYKEAKKAFKKKEIPVGVTIVKNGRVIAKSHNNRQSKHQVIGHAEINCILKAEKKLKDWRLNGCEMYVTLEPCDMCKMIINETRIDRIYYLLEQDNKNKKQKTQQIQTNDCDDVYDKYKELITKFFSKLRD